MENSQIFPRRLQKTLEPFLPRKEGILIYGARQTGKSTLLRQIYNSLPKAKYLSLDEEQTCQLLQDNPQGTLEQIAQNAENIFIDEFQKAPTVTTTVKYLIDKSPRPPKFFLSGSLSDTITKGGDSMIGRVWRFPLFSLSFREYLEAKEIKNLPEITWENISPKKLQIALLEKSSLLQRELQSYLLNGGYPAVLNFSHEEEFKVFFLNLKMTFFEKDLLERLRLGQKQHLTNLAIILAKRVGSPLSYNGLSQELGIDLKTVQKLMEILRQSFWIETVFSDAKYGSEFKNKFKVYFNDTGLRNFMAEINQIWDFEMGPIYENAVFGVLQRYSGYFNESGALHFWQTYNGGEIDFILKQKGEMWAIEVKSGSITKPNIFPSVRKFLSLNKSARAIIINKDFYGEVKVENATVYFLPLYAFALLI